MFENTIEPLESRRRPRPVAAHADEVSKQHNLYTNDQLTLRGKARVYFADYQQKTEVMRAHENRISTKSDDRQTVSAMLDLAQSRGWDRIKLTGTAEFKREAWVQAQVRGIETEGYKPKQTDLQEAARRKEAVNPVERNAEHATKKAEAPTVRQEATVAAEATPRPQQKQRQEEAAVWNVVENQGSAARASGAAQQQPAAKAAQKPAAEAA